MFGFGDSGLGSIGCIQGLLQGCYRGFRVQDSRLGFLL